MSLARFSLLSGLALPLLALSTSAQAGEPRTLVAEGQGGQQARGHDSESAARAAEEQTERAESARAGEQNGAGVQDDGEPSPDDGTPPSDGGVTPAAEGPEKPASDGKSKPKSKSKGLALGKADKNDRKEIPWIKRWKPERNMIEVGVFGGLYRTSQHKHELYEWDPDKGATNGHRQMAPNSPEVGVRGGYYPLTFLGVEAEVAAILAKAETSPKLPATIISARGGAVLQLPLASIVPFVSIMGGALIMRSDPAVLGNDVDQMMHVGGGVKAYINRQIMVRVDVRDVIAPRKGSDNVFNGHNLEALLGLSITLGRKKDAPKPKEEPVAARKDTDGDGYFDDEDGCIDQAETFNDYKDEDGCPELDRDGDGFWDDQDQCPDEAGVAPDGCPIRDRDGDGILDPDDKCPDDPETVNGFEDSDGCPDERPKELEKFAGVIEGIFFDTDKDTIKKDSIKILDNAASVLSKFPDTRIKVIGHTDDQGDRDHNMDLSRRRAEAVKKYLMDKGIDAARLSTEGVGPDQPRADNKTKKGRAQNRRIEFQLGQ